MSKSDTSPPWRLHDDSGATYFLASRQIGSPSGYFTLQHTSWSCEISGSHGGEYGAESLVGTAPCSLGV
jgi:hypothetical protein